MKQGLAYEALLPQGKAAYDHVARALEAGQTTIDSGKLHGQDPLTILQAVVGDAPGMIWFDKSAIRRQLSLLGSTKILLTGVITGGERRRMERELDEAVGGVLAAIEAENPLTDYDRLICLYEHLQRTIIYDEEELRHCASRGQIGDPWSHNAYGALVKGRAVCDGIAAGLALVASAMGYDATVVPGNAARDDSTEEHAWNVIRVGGQCYHMDLTWDLSKSKALGICGYDYFCLDDGTIAMDHQWPAGIVPKCGVTTLSWFHYNRCYANNLTQVKEIFGRYARSKMTVVRLRLADGVAVPKDEGRTLGQMLVEALSVAGRPSAIRFFWNPYVRSFTARIGI